MKSAGAPTESADYPQHWHADVLLADGGTARLRPIGPADGDSLQRLFLRLSPRTIYQRFHGAHAPRLSEEEIHRFTHVDHVDRLALVAVIGTDLVGVARAERYRGRALAEVAFLVRDDQQGRGVASILLEHLAAAAQERGITRFEAYVLAGNREMIGVFRDAGYQIVAESEAGELTLSFELATTERSMAVQQAREHAAEVQSVGRLLTPTRVAVVFDGTPAGDRLGEPLLAAAVSASGPQVLAVHPRQPRIGGVAAVPRLRQLEQADLVVAATGPDELLSVAQDTAAVRAQALVALVDAGPGPHPQLRDLVRQEGLRLLGPASAGLVNRPAGLVLWDGAVPPPGRVGIFCQSAPAARALLAHAQRRGVGVSSVIDAGDRADVSGNDVLQYWEDDPGTEVALMVLQTFGNPRKFLRLARRFGRNKPLIVVRPVADGVVDDLLRQAGVIRVAGLAQGLDAARLCIAGAPHNRTVAIRSADRAATRLAAEALQANGLLPTDVVHSAGAELVVTARAAPRLSEPSTGAGFRSSGGAAGRPVITLALGAELRGGGRGVMFRWPDSAAAALARAASWQEWRAQPVDIPRESSTRTLHRAQRWLARHAGGRTDVSLSREAIAEILADYDLQVIPWTPVGDPAECSRAAEAILSAAQAEPAGAAAAAVVVKVAARDARHRPDLGTVLTDLTQPEQASLAFTTLAARFPNAPIVVQRQQPVGVPVLLTSHEDGQLGPVVSAAVGSVNAALGTDVARRSAPLGPAAARELISSAPSAVLLHGWRGTPAADLTALAAAAEALGRLATDLPEIHDVALTPVLVHQHGISVLDASITLTPPIGRRPDTGPRRMV